MRIWVSPSTTGCRPGGECRLQDPDGHVLMLAQIRATYRRFDEGTPVANTPKTRPTTASVADYIARIEDPVRRADCTQLVRLMQEVADAPPVMWGEGIVGFGSYVYQYKSGQALEWPVAAFASRKTDLTVYLMAGFDAHADLLQRLGKHKTSKACLYLKRLSDVDMAVLRELVERSVAETRALHKAAR